MMKTKNRKTIKQFKKFLAVGVMNTSIDFLILNLLILTLGLSKGSFNYVIFRIISASVATINGFYWNKNWVFKKKNKNTGKTFGKYLAVVFFGIIIGTIISTFSFILISNYFSFLSAQLAANLGAAIGVGAVVFWDFAGYKWMVFKS